LSSQLTEYFTIYSCFSGFAVACCKADATRWQWAVVLAVLSLAAAPASAQSVAPAGITQKTVGELERRKSDGGIVRYTLLPADHVVGGDQLVYTVEIRNTTNHPIGQVVAISPIPERMGYVAGSAAGPGCDIDFSVDGGANFGKPQDLLIALPAGQTHISVGS
jgi:uncharacterized repeat protein (TIGR01451 family)